jgi:hypothetical protein
MRAHAAQNSSSHTFASMLCRCCTSSDCGCCGRLTMDAGKAQAQGGCCADSTDAALAHLQYEALYQTKLFTTNWSVPWQAVSKASWGAAWRCVAL